MRFLIILILFSSCSASWHVKKARKKDPTLFEMKRDTAILSVPKASFTLGNVINRQVELIQPVNISGTSKDVLIKYLRVVDTVNNIDSVFIEVDCPDQEIIYEREKIYVKPTLWEKAKYFITFLGILLVFYVAYRIFIGKLNDF